MSKYLCYEISDCSQCKFLKEHRVPIKRSVVGESGPYELEYHCYKVVGIPMLLRSFPIIPDECPLPDAGETHIAIRKIVSYYS